MPFFQKRSSSTILYGIKLISESIIHRDRGISALLIRSTAPNPDFLIGGRSTAQYQPWAPRLHSGPWACQESRRGGRRCTPGGGPENKGAAQRRKNRFDPIRGKHLSGKAQNSSFLQNQLKQPSFHSDSFGETIAILSAMLLLATFTSLFFEKGVYYNRKSTMRICLDPYE